MCTRANSSQTTVMTCTNCHKEQDCYKCGNKIEVHRSGESFIGHVCDKAEHKVMVTKCPKCDKARSSMPSRQNVRFCKPCNAASGNNQFSHKCCFESL